MKLSLFAMQDKDTLGFCSEVHWVQGVHVASHGMKIAFNQHNCKVFRRYDDTSLEAIQKSELIKMIWL